MFNISFVGFVKKKYITKIPLKFNKSVSQYHRELLVEFEMSAAPIVTNLFWTTYLFVHNKFRYLVHRFICIRL